MSKYKLTDEVKQVGGVKLYRIEATKDFGNVKKGDKGGFIEKESNLSGNAWVSGNALVSGNAWVSGNALVSGNARVYGDAWVCGNAWVSGNARVSGDAQVYGDARVYGDAQVYGDARVCGKKHYTKGWFIGGDDTGKFTNITDQMGTDYWKAQYVLGDYEITDQEPQRDTTNPKEITIDGATYILKDEV